MFIINFKTYEEASGENAVVLAKIASEISNETSVEIVLCPQTIDLRQVLAVYPKVWLQHVDSAERGRATGYLPAETAKEAGAEGTLLNHSEHLLKADELQKANDAAKTHGLSSLIFAGDIESLKAALTLKPDYVSYEPPELVGSTKETVATAHPDVIEVAAKLANEANIPLVVGAGIHSMEDVKTSINLGAAGIAVATSVVKAENPKEEILNLLKGFEK